jgi:hypothetical protein
MLILGKLTNRILDHAQRLRKKVAGASSRLSQHAESIGTVCDSSALHIIGLDHGAKVRLRRRFPLQLLLGALRVIPVPAGQLFATISRSIHFALQKHKLPKAGFCQISFRGFHFGFLLSAKDGQVIPINSDQPFNRKGLLSNPSRQC